MSLTTLASAIRNKNSNYIAHIATAMYNNDAWNGETPQVIRDLIFARRTQSKFSGTYKQVREIIEQYFTPYLSHFPETYRRVDDVINRLPQIIERIREIRNQEAARQEEIVQLEAEKAALEERINRLKELSPNVPITPPPPQPLPRYEGSAEQLYNQASFEAERQEEQEQNHSPTIIPDDMTPEEYAQMEDNMMNITKFATLSSDVKRMYDMINLSDVIHESIDDLEHYQEILPIRTPPRPPTPPPPTTNEPYRTEHDVEIDRLISLVEDNEPVGSDKTYNSISDLMNALNTKPFGTRININNFTEEQLSVLGKYLNDWFTERIEPHMNDSMLIAYEIDGEKRVLHTVQKDLNRIKEMFTNNQFFNIDKAYDSANAYDETIYLNMFDRIYFLDFSHATKRPDKYRQVHGDGFFPRKLSGNYKLFEPFLERYQVYASYVDADNKTKPTVNNPCFTYALQQAGIDKETTDKILAYVGFQKRINRKQWTDICNEFNLRIHLRIVNEKGQIDSGNYNNKGWYGPENGQEVHLAEYLNHVFIDEALPITGFAVRNWDNIYNLNDNIEFLFKTAQLKKGRPSIDTKRANLRSLDVIKAIYEAGGF